MFRDIYLRLESQNSSNFSNSFRVRSSKSSTWSVLLLLFGGFLTSVSGFSSSELDSSTVIAWENKPRTVDSRYAVDADSQYLDNLINCSLFDFDAAGGLRSDLVDEFQWKNTRELILRLRKDYKFFNGNSVLAKDVVDTYKFFLKSKPATPSPRSSAFKQIKSIESLDDYTVKIELVEADSTLLGNLVIGIIPEGKGGEEPLDFAMKTPTCGPFLLEKVGINSIDLKRNPHYFKLPNTKQITIKLVGDESTRYAKLLKGEIDIVQNLLNYEALDKFEKQTSKSKKNKKDKREDFQVLSSPALRTSYLGFNMRDPRLGKKEIRQAIALAIDRNKIIDHVYHGYATPAKTMLPPHHPFFNKELKGYSYNVSRARALIKKSGLKPKELTFTLKTTNNLTRVVLAKAIASDLAKIGIKVKVQSLEWGRFKADVEKGRVAMWMLSWIGFKDPDIYRYAFSSESFPPNGGNRGFYHNKDLDHLLKIAKKEVDDEKRKDLYLKVQDLVADEMPYVFLWHEKNYAVVNKKISGFQVYADGRYASLAKVRKKVLN